MALSLKGRSLLSVADLTREEIAEVLRVAAAQKLALSGAEGAGQVPGEQLMSAARGRMLALLFDKSSLRTRVGFEVAINQLGGSALYLAPADVRMGEREPVRDVARVLGRMADAIAARLSSHQQTRELAQFSGVPVINAMSNLEHPCQALADLLTIQERKGRLRGVQLAWVGDGNNVCQSLLLAGAMFGLQLRIATPAAYEPRAEVVAKAEELGKASGASITIGNDAAAAVRGAEVVSTDVWVSAGMEEQATRRLIDFRAFRLNEELLKKAQPEAFVLHCLPAHRGEEITDEVVEGPQFAGFDQAENRLHTQRALLSLVFS